METPVTETGVNTYAQDLGGTRRIRSFQAAVDCRRFCGDSLTFELRYAQNGITSDPIPLDTVTLKNGETLLCYEAASPFSASHIYITAPCSVTLDGFEFSEQSGDDPLDDYPRCFDVDLKENYYLDTVWVRTQPDGYSHYSLYTSLNDRDFDLAAVKHNSEPCHKNGDTYSLGGKEARIIRVYLEYNSDSPESGFQGIGYTGEKSGNAVSERPEITVPRFEDSEYNTEITGEDTVNEVYGIIARRIGKQYMPWFSLELGGNRQHDWFELRDAHGKIGISGNTGVSLAAGVHYYLKYYCNVCLSQVGDQIAMPADVVPVNGTVYKETPAGIRYAYNYCTHSYTMAFWGTEEWRRELDWLALNGVNAVLDITAQEEVWRRFLTGIGYDHREIKSFLTGPAYYAWAYMANMFGFGGPVHWQGGIS